VALVACAVLIAIPFLWVRFPPITDLPQYLAQVRLLHETIADPEGPYRVQWLTPYLLAYVPLTVAWHVSPSEIAGRTAMLILALLWIVSIHWLAFKRGRSAAAAVLASLLFYNHTVYWGFYSFAIGWPVYVLWFLLTTRAPASSRRPKEVLLSLGAAWLLYLSHALWLVVGVAWFALRTAVARTPARTVVLRLAAVSPVLVMAAVWYHGFSGFSSSTHWVTPSSGRLSFSWIVDSTLGGLRGPAEYGLAGLLALWVILGVYQNRGRLSAAVDRDLCLAAAFFFGLALVLPDKHQNTIAFAARWQPMAAIMLLLGLPAPAWPRRVGQAVALTTAAVFMLVTSLAWVRFERYESNGLRESLDALPANMRVIGLDYVKTSSIVKGRPFLQQFAYAQVVRGGQLNFSFAEFAPMAVVYKAPRARPWTRGLEWYAERASRSDLSHFDYALVNGEARQHALLGGLAELTPVTGPSRWRLYRINTISR